jgi:peptide-methionine (S)-S-oxide reductase
MPREVATLAAGCFWCVEAVFAELRGVERVESGYAGGNLPQPTYEAVCTGRTGHAEVIQITFDPEQITYRDLLEVFFATHDPTTLNRQGADVGTQYRSAVFYHSPEQRQAAEETIAALTAAQAFPAPIVTEVTPYAADNYFPAEDYHQNYFALHPTQAYCSAVIPPKLAKLRRKFASRLKS